MTADFHPLDEYSTDDLVAALMRRSHAVLVASLPRGSVCGHPTFFTFVVLAMLASGSPSMAMRSARKFTSSVSRKTPAITR